MKRTKRTPSLLFALCGALVMVALFSSAPVAVTAQTFPTPTLSFALTPTPPPTPGPVTSLAVIEALRQAQALSEQIGRQAENANTILNAMQLLAAIFVLASLIALLVGIAMFFEYRASVRRARDLLNQVMEESRYMRVTQEAVKLRLGDMERLRDEVEGDIEAMQNSIQEQMARILTANTQHITDLQTVVSGRIQDMDGARRSVDSALGTMQDQLRDQVLRLSQLGDTQTRNLLEVLNNRLRDLETARRDVDNTIQEVRNQVRNELQKVYERGDVQMKAVAETLSSQMRELETLRDEVRVSAREFRDQIEGELVQANAALSDLQLIRSQVKNEVERVSAKMTEDRTQLFSRMDRVSQALAMAQAAQTAQAAQALTMFQMAQSQAAQGNLPAAFDTLQTSAALDPENQVIKAALGDVYLQLGMLEDGMKQIEAARAGKGELPAAEAAYAYGLLQLGDRDPASRDKLYAQAQALLLVLMEKYPNLLDFNGESVYGALGGLYRRQGRADQAIVAYERARHVTPQNTYPINNLALLHWTQGNQAKAREYFRQGAELGRQRINMRRADYWSWFDLITAELALGSSPEETVRLLDQVVDLVPGTEPLKKFLVGLETLQRAPNPPALVDQSIARVRAKIAESRA